MAKKPPKEEPKKTPPPKKPHECTPSRSQTVDGAVLYWCECGLKMMV